MIYTIGHSTRSQEELIALLKHYGVTTLLDIRTIPRSRYNPQFNTEELASILPTAGIAYRHFPTLGGLRRPNSNSINTGWKNSGFRGFADYMQTPQFSTALRDVIDLSGSEVLALMCAEALYWRCHRMLVSDALLAAGTQVRHIQSISAAPEHALTKFAQVEGQKIIYPPAPLPEGQLDLK